MSCQNSYPTGIAVDSSGKVYVADSGNHLSNAIRPTIHVNRKVAAAQEPPVNFCLIIGEHYILPAFQIIRENSLFQSFFW
ncbi:MAG: hypothetical protein CVV42_19970 [Candidatus Riflebacteria bacterium HGW-Riflebacteria-2]|nr:MAG: hypothetical protein CVV42_19970 [Candidatus Riflebacteria bacterium HGW-Riflebacteria-2]